MAIQLLRTDTQNKEFRQWLRQIEEIGGSYEIVVDDFCIVKVYVKFPQTPGVGEIKKLRYGRIFGTKNVSYIRQTFLPRLIDGKFIYTLNEEKN